MCVIKKLFWKLVGLIVLLFVGTFTIYFFNLDMKLTAAMEPMMMKWYDNMVKRDTHL